MPLVSDAASGGKRIVFMPYGKEWRSLRHIIHPVVLSGVGLTRSSSPHRRQNLTPLFKHLKPSSSHPTYWIAQKNFTCIIDATRQVLLCKLSTGIASRIVSHLSPAIEVTKGDSEDVRRIYGVLARFGTYRQPGSFLVDQFPALADNPLFDLISNWRKYGATVHKADAEVYSYYWNKMKKEVEAGTAQHSWGKGFVQSNYEKHGIDELGAAYAAYLFFYAG